ncbi:VWA domain-containing protein [Nocardia cyriacigeorgica]|uniref:VWA domain-containing protein n=1 Tax=Nocardia cyriacigeorgica TaxID=135487 RepID=UPI000CEA6DDC|nr:VWA domain-containing protein [Nocardia cyriacigeorgica]PPJ16880.1 hypothetical protein C5E43_00125 [Nocardia cyriacigeorgica]
MTDRLVAFVTLLREHGITAGPSETIDAAEAIVALGTDNTDHLRSGLAATLLRRNGQRSVFDQLFDLYFLGRGGFGEVREPNSDAIETLRDELVTTLAADNPDATTELARRALTELGGYGSGGQGAGASGVVTTASGAGWSSYLTLKALRPDDLTERIASRMGSATSEFDTAVHTIEADRRLRAFRTALQTEARIRSADLRGTDYIARRGVEMSTDRIDFLGAREQDLAEMRRLVHPLARKLATRLAARRRKAVRGQIDLRRTLRASMSTGGVPVTPVLRARKHGRPDLVVLADLSGSVTGFVTNHLDALGPRTSLLILGDARTNRTDPNLAALSLMLDKAKHAYWLNPEPARSWNTGDSAAHLYAEHVTMHECRNVVQLAEVVGRLLPT